MELNLPLVLTLSRLILAPLVIPFLFIKFLPLNSLFFNFIVFFIFALFSITDYLDGYFARRYNKISDLGQILDPIADKIFVSASLISLLYVNKISLFVVLVLISREFFVSGLREFGSSKKIKLDVSNLAKYKTTFQMLYIIFAILNTRYLMHELNLYNFAQSLLAFIVICLSVISAYKYFKVFINKSNLI